MERGAATPETVTRQARTMDAHRRRRRAKTTCKRGPREPEDGVVQALAGHHDPQELSCDGVVDQHKLRHIFPLGPLAVREAQDRFARLLVMDHVLYLEREDLPGAQQAEIPDVARRGRRPVLAERRVTDDAQESRERERERPTDHACPAPVAQVCLRCARVASVRR